MSTRPDFPAPTGYVSWYPDRRTTEAALPPNTSPLKNASNKSLRPN